MTTTAKLVTTPSEGHGLSDRLTGPLYQALTKGAPTDSIVALVLLEPVGCGQRKTAKGRHQHVVFDAVALEPILDSSEASNLMFRLQTLRDARNERAGQRTLPGNWPGMVDEERRVQALEQLEDWADGNGISLTELGAMWRDHWEIGDGEEKSFGNDGVHGDYRKAGWQQLLEFGYAKEILKRDEPLPHELREDDEERNGDDTVRGDGISTCQVCGGEGPLTDGLCPKDAKNVGLRVVGDEPDAAKPDRAAKS
jgi:hypothetical protein